MAASAVSTGSGSVGTRNSIRRVDPGTLDATRLRRLIDAGRTLVSQLDLDELLQRLIEVAGSITGARYVALGILDADRRELERFLTRGIDEDVRRAIGDLPRGCGILGVLIEDPRPLRLVSVGDDARSYGFPPGHPAMETFLGAPVMIRGEAWGNLYLTEKEGGAQFTVADEDAVVILAEWAGIAIENARLYQASERRRDELEVSVRRLEATTAIARAIGAETDLDRVLELIVKRGRALVGAAGMVIMLAEEPGLVVAATAGEISPGFRGTRLVAADADALRRSLGRARPRRARARPAELSRAFAGHAGRDRRGTGERERAAAPGVRGQRGDRRRHCPLDRGAAAARLCRERRGRARALGT